MSDLETKTVDKRARKKRFERIAGRIGLRLIIGPLKALPFSAAQAVGRMLGLLLYHVLGRYRRVAHKNIQLVFGGQLTKSEQLRMAKRVFIHFGEVAAEFVQLPQLSLKRIDEITVVVGQEELDRAKAMGKGYFIMTGHFGNWEFMARWLTAHGYPLSVVARDARDPEATRMMEEIRVGGGAKVLYRGNSARGILQLLKRNECIGILPDQNAADVFVPFFGFPTGTVDGPAVLHLKTGAPILFTWCVKLPDGRFQMTFEPPVMITPTEDRAADVERIMTLINSHLEAQIRQYPDQWLWLHDRWKASPGVFEDGERQLEDLKLTDTQKQHRGKSAL